MPSAASWSRIAAHVARCGCTPPQRRTEMSAVGAAETRHAKAIDAAFVPRCGHGPARPRRLTAPLGSAPARAPAPDPCLHCSPLTQIAPGLAARLLRARGTASTRRISGHRARAVAAALRVTDPALLHYRSVLFAAPARLPLSRHGGCRPLRDVLLAWVASTEAYRRARTRWFGALLWHVITQPRDRFALARGRPRLLSRAIQEASDPPLSTYCAFFAASVPSANHSTAAARYRCLPLCPHACRCRPVVCEDTVSHHRFIRRRSGSLLPTADALAALLQLTFGPGRLPTCERRGRLLPTGAGPHSCISHVALMGMPERPLYAYRPLKRSPRPRA